ncbi:thioredoxin family protein [Thalassovita sp.]|uniref:thioredoxin family protein n=1 Tax=Thalassovita sp. TaxID=1979401 RepID=UPI0029DE616F|nr:thioredoxin family protein [Thalassovita sp.]
MGLRLFLIFLASLLPLVNAVNAAELIMVERQGCQYCIAWTEKLGPIYPNTPEGRFAPLRVVDIADAPPADVTFARKVVYTPTFVLIEDNTEIGRIEGYPGEDFFWGLLGMMLKAKTDYRDPTG